jgi:hypothetical protein
LKDEFVDFEGVEFTGLKAVNRELDVTYKLAQLLFVVGRKGPRERPDDLTWRTRVEARPATSQSRSDLQVGRYGWPSTRTQNGALIAADPDASLSVLRAGKIDANLSRVHTADSPAALAPRID